MLSVSEQYNVEGNLVLRVHYGFDVWFYNCASRQYYLATNVSDPDEILELRTDTGKLPVSVMRVEPEDVDTFIKLAVDDFLSVPLDPTEVDEPVDPEGD